MVTKRINKTFRETAHSIIYTFFFFLKYVILPIILKSSIVCTFVQNECVLKLLFLFFCIKMREKNEKKKTTIRVMYKFFNIELTLIFDFYGENNNCFYFIFFFSHAIEIIWPFFLFNKYLCPCVNINNGQKHTKIWFFYF